MTTAADRKLNYILGANYEHDTLLDFQSSEFPAYSGLPYGSQLNNTYFPKSRSAAVFGNYGATGLAPDRIRQSASQPDFLAGVLEHMLADESLLIAFADSAGIDPADIARARGAFGGQWERDLP